MYTLAIGDALDAHRLDYAISRELGISRTYARKLVRGGHVVSLDGRRIKPSIKVESGESYRIDVPPVDRLDLEPEDVVFGVVYFDDDIIVVDKPAGLVVHPAPGNWRGTLVHGLLFRFPELGNLNGVERPGIVHRLDATTSGLMVVARNGLAQEKLFLAFKHRRVDKVYLALCHGTPRRPTGRIEMPIGRDSFNRRKMAITEEGREAVTEYEVLWCLRDFSLVRCVLLTGRTHQIRLHMKAIGCPLVGDELYAPSRKSPFETKRVFLHSWRLSFSHPRSGEVISFRSPLPADLRDFLKGLRSREPRSPCRSESSKILRT